MSESSTLNRAVELWRSDRSAEGESLLHAEVAKLERQFGRSSLEYEVANGELATFFWVVGKEHAATEIFREICSAPMPPAGDALRHRLTQLMNFGELLTTLGELDEAETVLQQGLAGRLQYYGREHPGYAFGLEPLAGVWLYRGNLEAALTAIDETIDIFDNAGHERTIGALVLRAEILKTGGVENYLFENLESADTESIEDFANKLFARVTNFTPPAIARLLLLDLAQLLAVKFGRDDHNLLSTYAKIAELERKLGQDSDAQIRQGAIQQILDSYQRQGNIEGTISALMGLGSAQIDNHEVEAALKSYSSALAIAEGSKDPQLAIQVTRNYGLLLKEIGQKSTARQMLAKSIELAKQHDLVEDMARGQIALGIFLQHEGDLQAAKNLLQLGVVKLNPSDRDRVCGCNHLRAIENGSPCCAEGMPATILASCREFMLSKIPANKIDDIQITYSDDDGLSVSLSFPDRIDDKERKLISLQINYAFREFQQNMTRD